MSNLKSVALTVMDLLAFNMQKSIGHVTLAMPHFGKFPVISRLELGTCVSNLKSIARGMEVEIPQKSCPLV